jgi:formylglycine-generating enzyme required for sulfatase activity
MVSLSLTDSRKMELVLIPPGEFLLGSPDGPADERPVSRVRIERPFYMSRHEVTNEQFRALVDPSHNSGHVAWRSIDWRGEGYPLSGATQPVVRVSYRQAMEFCKALSVSSGKTVRLPTEAQWEWACRAGSDKPMWYGTADDDFSKAENLAGREQRRFAFHGKRKWYLRDDRFDDGSMITAPVGSYHPNPWGLHDMHGNVCEWTRSAYYAHPNGRDVGTNQNTEPDRVIRGGSWSSRPTRARSSFRWKYPTWMKVHNVGFRVIIEAE